MRLLFKVYVGLSLITLVVLDSVLKPGLLEEPDNWEEESTIESESSIGTFPDRFLFEYEDDDRHGNGPNEEDATNSPTIFGYTKSPSVRPSMSPTVVPSSIPTLSASELPSSSPTSTPTMFPTRSASSVPSSHPSVFPSDLPSSLPSKLPSSAPSLDPCKGYDGNFGDINGELRFTIFFNYGVESDKTVETNMKATLSEQVKEVEQAMLDLLIARFFEDCNERRNLAGLNIFLGGDVNSHPADGVEFSDSDLERPFNVKKDKTASLTGSPTSTSNPHTREVVGISSSPVDLANGKKCAGDYKNDPQFDAECNVIEGRLTVYLSDIAFSNSTNVAMLQEIKSMMNEDLLDDCHPAILSVMFMTPSITVARSPVDDDFFEEETTVATAPPGGILMIALVGTIGMVVLVSFTRYRYSSQFKDDGSGELRELHDNTNIGSERFVEIDLSTPSMDRGLP